MRVPYVATGYGRGATIWLTSSLSHSHLTRVLQDAGHYHERPSMTVLEYGRAL